MNNTTQQHDKVYILQKDYDTPFGTIGKGVGKTFDEWKGVFPKLCHQDMIIKDDWFLPEQPKEWEILSLRMHDGSVIYKSGYIYPECFQTLINAKEFPIHSVKRL